MGSKPTLIKGFTNLYGLEIDPKTMNEEDDDADLNSLLGLNIDDAYPLSWDDKYLELCKEQNKKVESIVTFDKDMPQATNDF